MLRYVLKRILLLIPVMLAVILAIFMIMYIMPGSRTRSLPYRGDGDALDRLYDSLGVKDGVFAKYLRYCYNVFVHGDFGSGRNGVPVSKQLNLRLSKTLLLVGITTVVIFVLGVPIGIFAAVNRNKWQDHLVMACTVAGASFPSYWLAVILVIFFCIKINLLPTNGYLGPEYLILPVITLAIGGVAAVARMTRSSMVEVLGTDYVTALRAKGLAGKKVVYRHAFKNSLIPILTVFSSQISRIIGNTLIVEMCFSLPGIGYYLIHSITGRDQVATLACAAIISFILCVLNIITDVIYAVVQPQVRRSYAGRKSE